VSEVHPIEHLRYVARARGADPASLVRETSQALSSMRFDPSGLVVACRRIVERHPECGPLWWLCARLVTATEPFELAWEIAAEIDRDATPVELSRCLPDDATVVTIGWPDLAGRALARRGDITVSAVDSRHEASAFVQRLERNDVPCDLVPAEGLAAAVGAADVVLVEALAVSRVRVIAPLGSAAAAALGAELGVPVWLVAGVGRCLPDEYVSAMIDRQTGPGRPWDREHDVFRTSAVSHVVGPDGVSAVDPAVGVAALVAPGCPMAPELLRSSAI
jgi:hypothetical protein